MEIAIVPFLIPVCFTQMWTSVRAVLIDVEEASCATICLDPIAVNARRDMSTTHSGGRVWVGFQINPSEPLLRLPRLNFFTISFDPHCCSCLLFCGEGSRLLQQARVTRPLYPRCSVPARVILIMMGFARVFGLSAGSCSSHITLALTCTQGWPGT